MSALLSSLPVSASSAYKTVSGVNGPLVILDQVKVRATTDQLSDLRLTELDLRLTEPDLRLSEPDLRLTELDLTL